MMTQPCSRPRKLTQLPSLETQTVAFIEAARHHVPERVSMELSYARFRGYLRYYRDYAIDGEVLKEVLVIASVEIPKRYRRRGWLWRYVQLCAALVTDGGVLIECVVNRHLRAALRQRPEFVPIGTKSFLLRTCGKRDWPFSFDADSIYVSNVNLRG